MMIRRPMGPGMPGPMPLGPGQINQPGVMPGPAMGYGRPMLGSFKKGGKVKKTGVYKLHKGERVMPTKLSALVKAK